MTSTNTKALFLYPRIRDEIKQSISYSSKKITQVKIPAPPVLEDLQDTLMELIDIALLEIKTHIRAIRPNESPERQ